MTDGRTDGGDCNIPDAFLKKRGDNNGLSNDVASGSDIRPCIKIDKQLMVYIFSNTML